MQKQYKSEELQHYPITFQSRNPVIGALGVLNAGAAGDAALAQATPARLAGHTDP